MIGTLILSHGRLADELLTAGTTIAGGLPGFEAVSLDWSESFEHAQAKVHAAIDRLDTGDGVLILTDMFGGTPCNIALTFLQPGRVEIVTGVNLPMVVRLGCLGLREKPLTEAAHWLRDKTRSSVCVASDVQSGKLAACCGDLAETETSPKVTAALPQAVGVGSEGGG